MYPLYFRMRDVSLKYNLSSPKFSISSDSLNTKDALEVTKNIPSKQTIL
jgi:hypothetical protein